MTTTDPRLDEFLANVRRSGLLSEPDVHSQAAAIAEVKSVRDASAHFIQTGLLTPFQCRLLSEGKYRGFLVNAKYKILELIAVGGMGAVYLCEHMLMRRLVAMKVLPRDTANAAGSVERFLREARAVAALDHPNLVRAFDVDRLSNGNNHCLVLEFVDGVSLHQLVSKHGRQPVGRAVNVTLQAAEGLGYAHQAGLIHRDVKPSNVLLSRSGGVKILDLGLARFFDDKADNLTRQHGENAILGTADFIAPEQSTNAPIDTRADIYSLGCTLYYLLTGQPPFPDGNATTKMLWHQSRDPQPIDTFRADVPTGLLAVIGRMTAKNPEHRYADMTEVADALRPFDVMPDGLPAEDEMPTLCPAVRKLMTELPKTGRTGRSPSSLSMSDFALPPVHPATGDRHSRGNESETIDLTEIATWRGRPLVDPSSTTHEHPANETPRPLSQSRSQFSSPTAATHGNKKLFNVLVTGFVGVALLIGAVVAYQVNKPPAVVKSPVNTTATARR